jgi:hypothetical protein
MADLTQGTPLPNISSTTAQTTTAPDWYNTYLKDIATQGATAATNATFAGPTGMQTTAWQNAQNNVGNYQPALTSATNLVNAGTRSAADPNNPNGVQSFMSPYITDVVNKIGAQGQNNIARGLAPQVTAGVVGSGMFGSKQGANALASNIANAEQNITQQQASALQSGYGQALAAAQNQQGIDLSGAGAMGNLAGATQTLGLGDVNALSTMGGQQQTINQNQQLFPLQTLTAESNLMKGFTVPTNVSSTYNGPGQAGQYSASPLQTVTGLGALTAGIANTTGGQQLISWLQKNGYLPGP